MEAITGETAAGTAPGFRFHSSLADDVWHPEDRAAGAYEWWYFDAISDDGRDALVIIFLVGFIFSPRYNAEVAGHLKDPGAPSPAPADFPAVAFSLYRDGRPVVRAVNEHAPADFAAHTDRPSCRIGRSSFRLETTGGESRFILTLDESVRRGRRLNAHLEWLLTAGDFSRTGEAPLVDQTAVHEWNLVAPRCRVSGALEMHAQRGGKNIWKREFGGTGYHDHNRDRRWLPATIAEWQWGRAHFADATTAVFYRYRECANVAPVTKLFLVRDGVLSAHPAQLVEAERRPHHFGLRYPRTLRFAAEREGAPLTLRVRQRRIIDASFFYLRFLSDVALDMGSGETYQTVALTEHLAPRALRWRWLDWLVQMRIGRNGRGAFLP